MREDEEDLVDVVILEAEEGLAVEEVVSIQEVIVEEEAMAVEEEAHLQVIMDQDKSSIINVPNAVGLISEL